MVSGSEFELRPFPPRVVQLHYLKESLQLDITMVKGVYPTGQNLKKQNIQRCVLCAWSCVCFQLLNGDLMLIGELAHPAVMSIKLSMYFIVQSPCDTNSLLRASVGFAHIESWHRCYSLHPMVLVPELSPDSIDCSGSPIAKLILI